MPVELLLPRVKVPVLPMPSYVKLAMAFGVGAGASLFDKSRYRAHGAITTATWAAGLHGYCLDFDKANPDYVTIPAAHTQLNIPTGDFSFILRVYITSLAASVTLLMRGDAGDGGYNFYILSTGAIQLRSYDGASTEYTYTGAGVFTTLTWYTVGLSREGGSITLFKNGVAQAVTAGDHSTIRSIARHLVIGAHDNLIGSGFDGRIEFVRIFGGIALAPSEHLAWHNALA